MKQASRLSLAWCLAVGLGSSCNSAPPGAPAAVASTCTVSFQLDHSGKPFAQEALAIFPVVDGKISFAAEKMLGSGKTDEQGAATLDFKCSKQHTKYVIVWMPNGKCCGMLRHEGGAVSFDWDPMAAEVKRDMGKKTFEVFEF